MCGGDRKMSWNYRTPGIPEEYFITGNVPITKTEVRVISLSKLKLTEDLVVLDIGCGTGSVTVEMGLLCPNGLVYSIDSNEEAIELVNKNVERFQLNNVNIIKGEAPEALPTTAFDRIFIGGGSKNIVEIVDYVHKHLKTGGIVVANTILLESTYNLLKILSEKGFKDIECINVNISKAATVPGWMMKAQNPIYIISALK